MKSTTPDARPPNPRLLSRILEASPRLLTDSIDNSTLAPTEAPQGDETPRGPGHKFGLILLAVLSAFTAFCLYRCYACYRRRREKRMIDLRSAQADRVLGDMQMIPNRDLDDEII